MVNMNSRAFLIGITSIISILMGKSMANEGDPPFHMRSLGSHVNPSHVDATTTNDITPTEFAVNYVMEQKPLVLQDVTKEWPAFTAWTDDYLKTKYGKLEFRLGGGKKEKPSDMPPQGDVCLGRDTLEHFINTYQGKGDAKYIFSELPTPLYKYVNLPSPLGCGGISEGLVEVDFWMSSGSVHSSLRKSSFNVVTCMLTGSKDVKLVHPKHGDLLYEDIPGDNRRQDNTHYSYVDDTKVDMNEFPQVAELPEWFSAKLDTSDCLYVPSGSWSVVDSHGDKNIAVSFIFKGFKDLNATRMDSCPVESKAVSLEAVDPDWKYPGHGLMFMGNSPLTYYWDIMNTTCFSRWTYRVKHDFITSIIEYRMSYLPFSDTHVNPRADGLFDMLIDLSPEDYYSIDMLPSLTRDQLRKIGSEYLQPPIPENSCDHEYSYFRADTMRAIFENSSRIHNGSVSREDVVKAYLNMGGHLKIITKVWEDFAGEKTMKKFNDENEENFEDAIGKFYMFCMLEEEDIDGDDDEEDDTGTFGHEAEPVENIEPEVEVVEVDAPPKVVREEL